MRVLKPEIAKEREESLLRWIIQELVATRHPIGSELVAKKGRLGISSATIRNIMKKLEDEDYLYQSHTSGGRIPTDKAYRFYVNYITQIQKLAVKERGKIEREYHQQMDKIDQLIVQTSKMLAAFSHSAGFVYSPNISDCCVTRIDFIPLGPEYILGILVTESGAVQHWHIKLKQSISAQRLRFLNSFINNQVAGLQIKDAQRKLWEYLSSGHLEIHDIAELARQFLYDIEHHHDTAEDLHIEGIGQLIENVNMSDYNDFRDMISVMEEKKRFSMMLSEKLKELEHKGVVKSKVKVTIGAENELKELRNLSMVSATYKVGNKAVGLLGILGPKYMEYSKMISLVNFVSKLMEETIKEWENLVLPENRIIPLEHKTVIKTTKLRWK